MNKRQSNRLLNVAKALREYPHPERFTMSCYIHDLDTVHKSWCGTPGCALGTYASRPDLQRVFKVKYATDSQWNEKTQTYLEIQAPYLGYRGGVDVTYRDDVELASHLDEEALEHFGLELEEAEELFNETGCGNAQTPIEAAKYIEKFVARKILDDDNMVGQILARALDR
jgi:hypothetical protein